MQLDVNLIDLINNEGVELRKSGRAYMGRCPFHGDKKPSLAVYEDSNRFICFGCGERGDAIDFIMKLRNLNFQKSLAYLGIGGTAKLVKKSFGGSDRQRLIADFRKWANDYYAHLSSLYRATNSILEKCKSMEEAEELYLLYHELPVIEYHLDIILFGDDKQRFQLYREIGYDF